MDDPMDRRQIFFIWVLPLLWAVGSLMQSGAAGDENGFYVLSSLPAAWIARFVFAGRERVPEETLPVLVVLAGLPIMAAIGWVMDHLHVRRRLWAIVYLVGAASILTLALAGYGRIERAISKNGSLRAYVLLASSLGLFLSVFLATLLSGVARCVVRFREAP